MSQVSTPTQLNTCAVVVTYNPDDGFADRLNQIKRQFSMVFVVDNASTPSISLDRNGGLYNVYLIENEFNIGIAAALNQGVNMSIQKGFEWVVMLDQDTIPAHDMLETLMDVYRKCGGGSVIVGSNYWDVHRRQKFVRCAGAQAGFKERKTLITSGTLASLLLFKEIGLFREDYFIDSVDHEFCLRARAHGYRLVISCQPVMEHCIGAYVEGSSRLRQFMSYNHSSVRKYFIARNTIATVKAYFFLEPVWCIRQGMRLLSEFSCILLFEENKSKKTRAFLVGILHGATGKMGPIEKAWPNGIS